MALIKRADAHTHMSGAVTLDLGDLGRRGEALRAAAVAEAERIVREAHAERARIIEGAAEEGRRQGHAEGLKAGRAEGHESGKAGAIAEYADKLAAADEAWAAAMGEFVESRETLLLEARREVVRLAAAIAERVVHRVVALDPSVVEDQIGELLGLVTGPARVVLRVHPEDEPLARAVLPRLCARLSGNEHVSLETDPELSRGSCSARTVGGASVDATIETQLSRVVRDLLPDAEPSR